MQQTCSHYAVGFGSWLECAASVVKQHYMYVDAYAVMKAAMHAEMVNVHVNLL
jgi:hypothetical protein